MITIEQVKQLRDNTSVSVMQCRKALEEAGGDMEKALLILKKKSSDIAAKKSDRDASDGLIAIKSDGKKAGVVILNCETDFVAKNAEFIELVNNLANTALNVGKAAAETEANEKINLLIQTIGENMKLAKIEIVEGDNLGVYVHNGKSAVITCLKGGTKELAKDVAMHTAAMKPKFIKREDIAEVDKEAMRGVFAEEVAKSDKPEAIKQKILASKIDTFFKEQILLEQPFVKNPELTVGALVQKEGATVLRMIPYSLV